MSKRLNKFIAEVSAAARSVRPTARNTVHGDGGATFRTTVKFANEARATPYFREHGFTEHRIAADGGDGNFSTNVYGSVWTHPSGVTVRICTTFYGTAMFNITVAGWSDTACPWVV